MRFLKSLKYIFMPHFWLMNYPYSKVLDDVISKGIESNKVVVVDHYYCKVGEMWVWIANYPYAFGTVDNLRPSRITIEKLKEHTLKLGWKTAIEEVEEKILNRTEWHSPYVEASCYVKPEREGH